MSRGRRRQAPTWPPSAPASPPFDDWGLWRPSGLKGVAVGRLSYIVVDELSDRTCLLSISEWPRIDPQGRLRFRLDERPHLVRAAAPELASFLRKHGAWRQRGREPRVGDAFAGRTRTELLPERESEDEAHALAAAAGVSMSWLEPPIYDVTADARDAAKIALYSAVTPTLSRAEAKRLESPAGRRRR